MIRLLFVIGFVVLMSGLKSSAKEFYPETRAAIFIKKALKVKQVEILKEIVVADELKSENAIVIYQYKTADTEDARLAVFSEAKGRFEKFDYLVIADLNYVIQLVKVVKYRSEHGGEIASKKWLTQFKDYSDGPLKYGKDISALSGATFSAKSITSHIPELLKIVRDSCK